MKADKELVALERTSSSSGLTEIKELRRVIQPDAEFQWKAIQG